MQLTSTGELVRLRPFQSAVELLETLQAISLQVDEHWGYTWWVPQIYRREFEEHGGFGRGGRYSFFAIERLDTHEVVGYEVVELPLPDSIRLELGTVILERHQRQGFGREAKQLAMSFLFEHFPIMCVGAATLSKHARAVAGLEACGMQYEGAVRGYKFSMGRWEDMVTFCMLREDWQKLPNRTRVTRTSEKPGC